MPAATTTPTPPDSPGEGSTRVLGVQREGERAKLVTKSKPKGTLFLTLLPSSPFRRSWDEADVSLVGYLAVPDDQASVRTGTGTEADGEDVEARKVVNRVRPSLSHSIRNSL
jgi:hypothetical protein